MAAGNLDRRIVIQQPSATRDASGQLTPTWTTFATVWAQLTQGAATEDFKDPARQAERSVKFRIRYLAGVTTVMRVVWDGQVYAINDVAEPERRRWSDLTCTIQNGKSGPAA